MLDGFKSFILRGNVVDLAVGVVIGASFGDIVKSLVENLLTPLIGAIVKAPDFSNLFFTINDSKFMYGSFLNALIAFILVSAAVYFFVVTPINNLIARTKKNTIVEPTTKDCPECVSTVPIQAKKCAFCASPIA